LQRPVTVVAWKGDLQFGVEVDELAVVTQFECGPSGFRIECSRQRPALHL
jgi:hypothetical protein